MSKKSAPHWASCEKDTWCTPEVTGSANNQKELLPRIRRVNTISLDPCASWNPERHFAELNLQLDVPLLDQPGDGKIADWAELIFQSPSEGLVFMNPPYNGRKREIDVWIEKCAREAERGVEIVALVAASTGAQWFKWIWETAQAACFWEGRIKFLHPENGEAIGSSTVWSVFPYWGDNIDGFLDAFDGAGELCVLNQGRSEAISRAGLIMGSQHERGANGAAPLAETSE